MPNTQSAVPRIGVDQAVKGKSTRIWIDLDNSPHVPFFAPIIEQLKHRGYEIVLTARDAYQVRELADLFQFSYACVGHHWGKHWVMKAFGTCLRALQLVPLVIKQRPVLAVAHGSRSQLLASKLLGIPSLHIFDYEYARSLKTFGPTWLMAPEVIRASEHAGAAGGQILEYPGIKEDVYVPTFKPDPSVMARVGLDDQDIVVLLRPPASQAHYHSPKSDDLFAATVQFLAQAPGVRAIVLPRNRQQGDSIRKEWAELFSQRKLIVPDHAEDGLNLIWHSDLVVSGGGTMNREAAALGVPVYSIFRGTIGAVDRYLAESGRLVLIEKPSDLPNTIALVRRSRTPVLEIGDRPALTKIVGHIVRLAESNR